MTKTTPLNTEQTRAVLAYLGVEPAPPSPTFLDALVAAYVKCVPWESASRILRRSVMVNTADCPRWPETFWQQAQAQHTGGTCFESNYAFFALLRSLGFNGYLTVNDMNDVIGCHSAIVIRLEGEKYLVDVGLPVHQPLRLDSTQRTERESPYHTYYATPQVGMYEITRDRHPRPYCFTLVDRPLSDEDYRATVTHDYTEDGLFLDRVIVVRVVDGKVHRFTAEGVPYHIESFEEGDKTYIYLGDDLDYVARRVSEKFGVDLDIMRGALRITEGAM